MMTPDEIADELECLDEEILLADGFEEALIGYVERAGLPIMALYDREKCIEILMGQGMTDEEAEEFFQFNTVSAFIGDYTPCFATILKDPA